MNYSCLSISINHSFFPIRAMEGNHSDMSLLSTYAIHSHLQSSLTCMFSVRGNLQTQPRKAQSWKQPLNGV